MKIYILILVIAGALAEKPPYPPSGWKPEGARLVLPFRQQQPQDSYGAPPPPPPSGYGPPSSGYGPPSSPPSDYGPPSSPPPSGYGPPPAAPPSSGYGPPAPSTPPQEYGPPQNDSTATNPEQEDLDKVNEQVMAKLRQQEGSDTGVYYVYLPDGRLQRVQYTTAPLKAAEQQTFNRQTTFSNPRGAFSSQQGFGSFARQQTSYDAPPYPPSSPPAEQPPPSEQFNFASLRENKPANDIPGDPSRIFAKYDKVNKAQGTSQATEVVSQNGDGVKSPSKYVASVSFTDVAPINGPIYSYNNQPLVRVVRYASMFQ